MRLPLLLCVRTTSDVDYGGGDRGVGTTTTSTNVDRANLGGSAGVLDEYWSEEADGGGLSACISGACEPLEGVREDASAGGANVGGAQQSGFEMQLVPAYATKELFGK